MTVNTSKKGRGRDRGKRGGMALSQETKSQVLKRLRTNRKAYRKQKPSQVRQHRDMQHKHIFLKLCVTSKQQLTELLLYRLE